MTEMDRLQTKTKSPLRKYFPVIGGVLALCMLVLAFASSGWVDALAEDRAGGRYPPPVLDGDVDLTGIHESLGEVSRAEVAITGALWLVYMVVSWTLVAALAEATKPNKRIKKQLAVTEKSLKSERKEIHEEKKRRKKQRKKLQKKAFQENKEKGRSIEL